MQDTAQSRSGVTRRYLIAVLSPALLSTTGIIISFLTQTWHVPALILAFWRALFVLLTMIAALLIIRRSLLAVERRNLVYLLIYGFILAVFNSLWTLSVAINGAGIATVLAYSSTGFTALLGWWFLQERIDLGKIIAVALAFTGCVLVSNALDPAAWASNLLGIATGILTGLGYAVYSLLGRSAAQRGLNPWTTLAYSFGFASIFLLAFNLIPGSPIPGSAVRLDDLLWLRDSLLGWGMLILLAAGPTVGGFGLYNVGLSMLPASVMNLIATTEPVFSIVMAYFLFGDELTLIQIGGSLMIMAGVILLRVTETRLTAREQSGAT